MDSKEVEGMVADMESYLRGKEMSEGGWKGHASPSALAVGAAVVALHLAGKETYASQIGQGAIWLEGCRRDDGSWGDSPTSCSSWVSTLFAYAALQLLDRPSLSSRDYLLKALGGNFEQKLAGAIRTHYRAEPSFAEAVLLFCFVCGLLPERDCRPRRFSKPHGLTAGYLAPAWASEDLFCAERCRSFFFSSPKSFTPSLLERLQKLQATDGGFSASVPMTALAVLSLCLTGYGSHEMVDKACAYLCATQRKKGSWPIGADLSLKLTCLGLRALGKEIANRHALTLRFRHRLAEAGAAEADFPAEDLAAALLAMHQLAGTTYFPEVETAMERLLALSENEDAEVLAHTLMAFEAWLPDVPPQMQQRLRDTAARLLSRLQQMQQADGSWKALHFGDQDAPEAAAPVYATARVTSYLFRAVAPIGLRLAQKACGYLLAARNADGGWGGAPSASSKVIFTACALEALAYNPATKYELLGKAFDFLYAHYRKGTLLQAEPVGLFYPRLWYAEPLYNLLFTLSALKRVQLFQGQN